MSIAAYPKHDRFKPSGFDWVGDVPSHWEVEKLGSMLTAVSEKNRPNLPLLSITREQGIIERDIEDQDSNHNFIPDDLSDYKVLRKGQFGMNKMKAWQGSYGVSAHTGIVSPAYFIFDFAREVDPHFFNIAIRSKLYVSYFGSASDGVRIGQWDLNQSRMRQIPILLPPLPEQRAIAAFLDEKCAKVDEAVRIKEEQIALLRERRQILIQQAVTRGLNPAAPMKDSGIDWIGPIPAHWEAKPLLTEANIKSQTNRPDLQLLSVYLGLGVVKFDDVEEKRTNATSLDLSNYQVVEPGDLVLNNQQAWRGSVGVSFETGIVSPAYIVLGLSDRWDAEFANFYFRVGTTVAHYLINSKGVGTIQRNLYWPKLKRALVMIPPLEEQRAIVQHINFECGRIDSAISIKEDQITALKEYKTSLINAAVTGKIKVA
jgi:type I restriction enzyme S subunit